jgi:D-beta-D-heptose 7-phosphate kinase/D-beta-D-heptose 1-phosphate adenosyltransferase
MKRNCPECGFPMWFNRFGVYDVDDVWRCDCGVEIRNEIQGRWKALIVAASGGFDPLHVGHVRYLKAAKELGDQLIVILNTDEWLVKKKGYVFMKYEEREEILLALECVDKVVPQVDLDETVNMSLIKYIPHIFAKGGDRTADNIPELDTCKKLGIKTVFGVGGNKAQSSSELVKKSKKEKLKVYDL